MKTFYYCSIFAVCLLLLLSAGGCDSVLEVDPKGSLSQTNLQNERGVNALLVGAYSRLRALSRRPAGNASDDVGNAGSSTAFGTFDGNGSVSGSWSTIYDAVQRSNEVLRVLAMTVEAGNISPEAALQIEAEAKFLRGFYHLEAALWWRNVPFLDETISFTNNNFLVSNTEPIWPHIEADFQFAADNLTETKDEVGRANKWAAKAFLAKTYMFQLKFAEAKPLFEDIIANGVTVNGLKYDLNPLYWDNFSTVSKHGPEVVFAAQYATYVGGEAGAPLDYSRSGPHNSPVATCCGWTMPSEDLVNAHQTDPETGLPLLDPDGTPLFNETPVKTDQGLRSEDPFTPHEGPLDPRLDHNVGRRGIPYIDWGVHPGANWHRWPTVTSFSSKKHSPSQAGADSQKEQEWFNTPYSFMRFADVLLMAAEVEVEIGSLTRAEEYVNRVRARAANPEGWVKKYLDDSNPLGGFSDEPAANYHIGLYNGQFTQYGKEFAREAVRLERRIELALEYHRWFDLQRYDQLQPGYMGNTLNSYLERRLQIPNLVINYNPGWEFEIGVNEIGMIPLSEIELMESMSGGQVVLVQNPGYENE